MVDHFPSTERFIKEILNTGTFVVAIHDNFSRAFHFGGNHRHADFYQITYYLKGRERVLAGNRHYAAGEGDLFFFPPRCWHGSALNEKKEQFEILEIKFQLKHVLSSPLPVYTHVGIPADLLAAFYAIVNEFVMQRPQRETMMRLDLARLILLVLRRSLLKGPGSRFPSLKDSRTAEKRMTRVIRYLQVNYARKLNLSEIARINRSSISTLSHVFKEYIGIPPIKYLINYRLSMALNLMGHSERKLEDIALASGFSSVHYFSRLFRKQYNQSPRRYARLIYNISK